MKTIAVIGSTGSIGSTSLKIIKKYKKHFKVILLLANNNYKKLNKQFKIYNPKYISLINKNYLKKLNPQKKVLKSLDDFFNYNKKIDYVISGISGYSALDINFKILKIAKNLLIANKETIVCGGNVFLRYAKKNRCKIIPIDSEHYCINFFLKNFRKKIKIKSFHLTASGGPFLKKNPPKTISVKSVIKHPTWKMGKKNSINSANMTNKIIELFEAFFLFKTSIDQLKIKIENTSKIHSIISLSNGLDFFISHIPSMQIPIENSLINRKIFFNPKKNISTFDNVSFKLFNPSKKKFPIIDTGYKVLKQGHRAMIIFVVLNDRLVDMFLKGKKNFYSITNIIIDIFKNKKIVKYSKKGIRNLSDIKKTIKYANNLNI